eukprot:374457_1
MDGIHCYLLHQYDLGQAIYKKEELIQSTVDEKSDLHSFKENAFLIISQKINDVKKNSDIFLLREEYDFDSVLPDIESDKDGHTSNMEYLNVIYRATHSDEASTTKCTTTCIKKPSNIVNNCQHLQRLTRALKYYNEKVQKEWNEFCLNSYGHQMLDDYHHLLSAHSDEMDTIADELLNMYGFKKCLVQKCKFSDRHFNRDEIETTEFDESNNLINFYEREYDSLHFNLFHLFEVGYRFKIQNNDMKTHHLNDNDYVKCIDDEFNEMIKKVNYNRQKYKDRFERFKN